MSTSERITNLPVETVRLDSVVVGIRRRQKLTRIAALARSIEAHGLIHPILVRNGNELVTGQRRLEACRSLGWTTIPARRIDTLRDEELRAVELDENTERRDLDPYETTKQRLAEIRQAQAQAEAEVQAEVQASAELRPNMGRKSPGRGRPKKAGSQRDVATRSGVSRPEQQRVEDHVVLAERYPMFQKGWARHQVLEAGSILEALPEKEHPVVASLLDQPGIPPKKAISILENLAQMKPSQRAEIYQEAKSPDSHVRGNALAKAAALPPPRIRRSCYSRKPEPIFGRRRRSVAWRPCRRRSWMSRTLCTS
jgi:ParB family chromosome partitioning protein